MGGAGPSAGRPGCFPVGEALCPPSCWRGPGPWHQASSSSLPWCLPRAISRGCSPRTPSQAADQSARSSGHCLGSVTPRHSRQPLAAGSVASRLWGHHQGVVEVLGTETQGSVQDVAGPPCLSACSFLFPSQQDPASQAFSILLGPEGGGHQTLTSALAGCRFKLGVSCLLAGSSSGQGDRVASGL